MQVLPVGEFYTVGRSAREPQPDRVAVLIRMVAVLARAEEAAAVCTELRL